MATLQVKNLPDDIHDKLRARAARQGVSMSELVSQVLRREVAKPSLREWLDDLDKMPPREKDVDTQAVMDEIRGPWPDEADAGR